MTYKEAREILAQRRNEHFASIVSVSKNEKEDFFKLHNAYNKAIDAIDVMIKIVDGISSEINT